MRTYFIQECLKIRFKPNIPEVATAGIENCSRPKNLSNIFNFVAVLEKKIISIVNEINMRGLF